MKVFRTRDVKLPVRGTERSAGLDFYIPNEGDFFNGKCEYYLYPGYSIKIPSGIKAKIPRGYMLKFCNKSGFCADNLSIVGAEVVDEDYQGEIHLHIINVGRERVRLRRGQKLVQGILIPVNYEGVEEAGSEEELWNGEQTERGTGGFGSTGSGLERENLSTHERKYGHP